jgi:glucans biosynthesis protein
VYWRPEQGLRRGERFKYAYRLTWPDDAPGSPGIAPVVRSAGGHKLFSDHTEVSIDYSNLMVDKLDEVVVYATMSPGQVVESRIQANPAVNGARVFLSLGSDEPSSEMRVDLKIGDTPVAETWLYRWLNDY